MRISDCSSDVCSSDLIAVLDATGRPHFRPGIIEEPPPATRDVVKFQIQAMRLLGGYGVADQVFRLEDTENRSEEHTSELQSLMRISYAVFCLKKKNTQAKKLKNT